MNHKSTAEGIIIKGLCSCNSGPGQEMGLYWHSRSALPTPPHAVFLSLAPLSSPGLASTLTANSVGAFCLFLDFI